MIFFAFFHASEREIEKKRQQMGTMPSGAVLFLLPATRSRPHATAGIGRESPRAARLDRPLFAGKGYRWI